MFYRTFWVKLCNGFFFYSNIVVKKISSFQYVAKFSLINRTRKENVQQKTSLQTACNFFYLVLWRKKNVGRKPFISLLCHRENYFLFRSKIEAIKRSGKLLQRIRTSKLRNFGLIDSHNDVYSSMSCFLPSTVSINDEMCFRAKAVNSWLSISKICWFCRLHKFKYISFSNARKFCANLWCQQNVAISRAKTLYKTDTRKWSYVCTTKKSLSISQIMTTTKSLVWFINCFSCGTCVILFIIYNITNTISQLLYVHEISFFVCLFVTEIGLNFEIFGAREIE